MAAAELAAAAQGHGGEEMAEHTQCQQDFERQHDAEGRRKRVLQQRQIAVQHHADARTVQHQQHPRHDFAGAIADGAFHGKHEARRYLRPYAFEYQHFKKHRADKHQRGKNMQGQENGIPVHHAASFLSLGAGCFSAVQTALYAVFMRRTAASTPVRPVAGLRLGCGQACSAHSG